MLQDAYNGLPGTTRPVFPPGIALAITVLAINLVADGLRDSLGREVYNVKAFTE
jgi:ABC-type dipeptide/oligopeptide/nickel transport system permease subunit